jgi:hypothetical protein
VFALLLALRRAFASLPRATSYLAPVALLGVGVLSWSLFSGIEIAFFMALWAGAFVMWDELGRRAGTGPPRRSPSRKRFQQHQVSVRMDE